VRAEVTSEKSAEQRPSVVQSASAYIKDVRIEMTKVTWPARAELRESTFVVIVMVLLVSLFIGVVDRGLTIAFEAFIRAIGS
jgi:preprotein translocase subunit SecE